MNVKKSAWLFIVLIGVVSLFADMTYEGARSITGPFLATLGASATMVGVIAGLGELFGHSMRFLSGIIADRTQKYWVVIFVGYFINLFAVPLLALAGSWQMAAVLMILERTGRAVRNPARDAMLAHATTQVGVGKGFGVHEALDQVGAVLGPLIVGIVFYFSRHYTTSFAVLLVPALIAVAVLIVARAKYRDPQNLEVVKKDWNQVASKRYFWIYLTALSLIGAGFADYSLIAFHFDKSNQVSPDLIPVMYALAMGSDAVAALLLGKFFDQYGIKTVLISTVVALWFAPLVFTGNSLTALFGMILWGVGMGAQESIVRAVLTGILPSGKFATGFGLFYAVFGVAWFLGSAFMGWLYDISPVWVVVFSVGMQLLSIPFFMWLMSSKNRLK
ncbi:MAG: MFS transporter [Microbacter sp.]